LFIATATADGQPYIQHRGGPKGFLKVLGPSTLGFADFSGNRQYITVGRLAENPAVCLFLIDYEHRARVKLWGRASSARFSSRSTHGMSTAVSTFHRSSRRQMLQ
jgi:predicted pyridoxine 5'-phosphate oxidase superfamily flavin-nucleotide-binding protein